MMSEAKSSGSAEGRGGAEAEAAPRAMERGTRRHYGRFYWPLALSGFALLLEQQFQNGVLAQYPDAEVELATFALASSSFQMINAMLVFMPQLVAVMARTVADRRLCSRFANGAGLLLALPLLFMGYTAPGHDLLAWWMNIPPGQLPEVVRYLQWLAPLTWFNAWRYYGTGVLVLAERTRTVTLLNGLHLGVLVAVLLTGLQRSWSPIRTLALATVTANLLHFILCLLTVRRTHIPDHQRQTASTATIGGLLAFYWPMAVTSLFFSMSRPVLYAYVNLTAAASATIAALRVGFDFTAMFQNPINQFRHVYATFGAADPKGVTRFMYRVTALYLGAMCVVVFTPLSRLFFGRLMGLDGAVLVLTLRVTRVLLLLPLLIMIRNLYHGRMMVRRKTTFMAVAALARVGAIALAAAGLQRAGRLDATSSALVLILGFLAEALVVRTAVRRADAAA